MKIETINTLVGILSGIRINRIADKAVKAGLLKDYLALRKVAKEAEAEKDDIVSKFQSDWADELSDVDAMRKDGKPVVGHDAYLDAERDALDAIGEIYAREAVVDLVKVSPKPLFDPDVWADDITLGQIPGSIDFMTANGVTE